MSKMAILYCKRIQDVSCITCAKCLKGMAERDGEFARHDEIEPFGKFGVEAVLGTHTC